MATISGATNEKVYSITKWLGLNEHPDGDTNLKMGEASKMVNWKITRDGNLKRRPGQEFIIGLCNEYVLDEFKDVVPLSSYSDGNTVITVYNDVSLTAIPGTVVPVGTSGVVAQGVYRVDSASVVEGVLSGTEEVPFVVDRGVVYAGESNTMTVAEFAEALAALGSDEYLYIVDEGSLYAMRNDGIVHDNTGYHFEGYEAKAVLPPGEPDHPVMGMWAGLAGGELNFLAACDNTVWRLYKSSEGVFSRSFLSEMNTDKGVNFIPFDNKVYIQNGYGYYVYDGTTVEAVEGYVPIVSVSIGPLDTDTSDPPDGTYEEPSQAGTITGYYANRLTPKRKVWLSPDGTNSTFRLPEPAKEIVAVTKLDDGTSLEYTFTTGTTDVTLTTVPDRATNSIEVEYAVSTHEDDPDIPDYRAQVEGNLFCEIFSGQTDSALFFYGDGTNRALYTGMDYDGLARADYFPDQYELRVGDSNTPITSMIRHYSALLAYKTDSTWALSYGTTELATGDLTTAVYITPVNREKGNAAPGQVRLVENNPVTCSGSELYHWINSSYYTSQLSRDERQAKRISDRVQRSIKEIDFANCCMWDDNDGQEFYISGNGVTLVWNYVNDTWYRYEGLDAVKMCNFQGDVFVGTSEGRVLRLSDRMDTDEGYAIKAEWESGAMDFGASHMRKYSSMMWVGLKPVDGTSVDVTVETDRKAKFQEKVISSDVAKVDGQPFMVRSKIKAKKFVFYRLMLRVNKKMPAVTVTNVDFRVRQTGYSK